MKKRAMIAAAAAVLALLAVFCGCQRNARFDYSELNYRLRERAPEFCFDEEALFFSEGVYYAYYALYGEEDTLLTLKEDETGRLERITLTLSAPYTEACESFRTLAAALAEIFIPAAQTDRLLAETGLDAPAVLRENWLMTYEQGFYRAALFGTDLSTTFILEYG